jgi:anti-sigma factor RsiW
MALVALAGRSRGEAAAELGVVVSELVEGLATGRKALRRSLQPLSASGWCERAERLISDRLDDELDARGAARLDVHLRNCPRCVEHERRLVQATDALVAQAAGPVPSEIGPATPSVQLTVVEPTEPPQPVEPGPTPRQVARGVTWTLLVVAAVIVALAALALIVAGMLGASI